MFTPHVVKSVKLVSMIHMSVSTHFTSMVPEESFCSFGTLKWVGGNSKGMKLHSDNMILAL